MKHYDGARYFNPWPGFEMQGFGALLKWGIGRMFRDKSGIPDNYDFPVEEKALQKFQEAEGDAVCWIGHSSFLLRLDGLHILLDPVWSERASPVSFAGPKREVPPPIALEDLPEIDLVLQSHNHYDHLDETVINYLGNQPFYIVPKGVGDFLKAHGIDRFAELDWWESHEFQQLKITATPAQHFTARGMGDRFKTLWCGFTLKSKKLNFYYAGDTGYCPVFPEIGERLGPFDFAAIPIGAYLPRWFMRPVHINPKEAVKIFQEVQARKFIAMHWGTFPLADEPLNQPPKDLAKAVEEAQLPDEDFWVLMHGETRVLKAQTR